MRIIFNVKISQSMVTVLVERGKIMGVWSVQMLLDAIVCFMFAGGWVLGGLC